MKTALLFAAITFVGLIQNPASTPDDPREALLDALQPQTKPTKPPAALELLPGYIHASTVDFEGNVSGEIRKSGSVVIQYGYSPSRDRYSTEYPVDKNRYREFLEESINGRLLWRGFRSGRYEVNIECGSRGFSYIVRFTSEIKKSTQADDMVAMAKSVALTNDQSGLGCVFIFPTLLPGYQQSLSMDEEANFLGKITKLGLSIEYKMPVAPYRLRVPEDHSQYREYVEETINGHHLWRGFESDQYLVNVDLCRVPEYSHIVTFRARVKDISETADMTTIARSLLRSKTRRVRGCVSMD